MTETAYETLPEIEPAEPKSSTGTVVMKFGGTSVADPDKIRKVAARLVATKKSGSRVVAVVSAMGYHTDELCDRYDVRVYLAPPEALRRKWKVDRDCSRRGCSCHRSSAISSRGSR